MVGWGWRTGHRRGCYAGPGERTSQRAGSGGDRGSYLLLLYIYQSTGDTDCIQCGRGIPAILFFFLSLGACCRSDLCLVCWSSRGRPHSFLQKTIMLVSKKKNNHVSIHQYYGLPRYAALFTGGLSSPCDQESLAMYACFRKSSSLARQKETKGIAIFYICEFSCNSVTVLVNQPV